MTLRLTKERLAKSLITLTKERLVKTFITLSIAKTILAVFVFVLYFFNYYYFFNTIFVLFQAFIFLSFRITRKHKNSQEETKDVEMHDLRLTLHKLEHRCPILRLIIHRLEHYFLDGSLRQFGAIIACIS